MATTLSAQLQVLKSFLQVESEPIKKPFVRASVLFDPKEAADIDLDTIFSISLSGLEALIATDVRFRSFKGSLFSRKSRELDREMMGGEENIKINASIALFLRLLSGYLHLPSALKTLEYLIRRYKVHAYNIEELVLCALPYHDTESFVRIVQLVDLGNNKWRFLEGVKNRGAPLPRKVIVQQCICDMGFLETLCNYALPEKKVQPSREVVCFCTAVVVETLGSVPSLDSDTIKRILPFVFEGLNPVTKGGGSDHKAGAIMIVGLLASRATLSPKLITNLITAIARVAQQDARQSADLSRIRLLVMAIISLVQSQTVQLFPKKGLEFLKDVRDLSGVLMALSKEFNIEKFLSLYLETLVDYSYFDDSLRPALIKTLETALAKEYVENIVIKVLSVCMKLSGKTEKSYLHESGSWAKQILVVVNRRYPSELHGAVHKFMEDPKMSLKHDSIFEILCLMLDGGMDMPLEISNLRIWFSLEHPKAGVRRATLSSLAASDLLRAKTFDSQNQINVQDTILRRLRDDDLGVVQAALSLDGLTRVVNPLCLFEAFQDIVLRCTDILTGNLDSSSQACNVAISCLDGAILTFQQHQLDSKKIATMVFPLLLILPKTWRLNCKALELVKNIHWPFYSCLSDSYDHMSTSPLKKFESSVATSMNVKTVGAMGECLLRNVEEYIPWLVECCNTSKLSKTLFFLVMLQSFMIEKEGLCHFSTLFQACFPVLKNEWHEVEAQGDVLAEEFNNGKLEESCKEVMRRLFDWKISALNSHILICTYWSLLKTANTVGVQGFLVDNGEGVQILDDLFVFFATSSLKNLFMEQLHLLVLKSSISPVQFLSKFFTEEGFSTTVQVTSLRTLTMICSTFMSSHKSGMSVSSQMQLLLGFPSLLVPLASGNQDICTASVNCIKSLHKLSIHIGKAASRSGKDTNEWTPAFGELLSLIIQQQKLISSDVNFLSSLMVSVLCSSSQSLLAPQNIDKRFDLSTKEAILHFILRSAVNFSAYGKLVVFSLFKGMGSTILNVEEVKLLLSELLDRRKRYHIEHDRSCQGLSKTEIDTLCFLLESCGDVSSSTMLESLFKALHVNGVCLEDSAVIRPCVTVLEKLSSAFYDSLTTKVQDELVLELVLLFRNENGDIQDTTREALLRINVSWSTIGRLLDLILVQEHQRSGSMDSKMKRKKSTKDTISDIRNNLFNRGDTVLFFLSSLLDVLLLKKDMVNRVSLIEPLFKLLRKIFENDWLSQLVDQAEKGSLDSEGYIQQTMLLVLEDISSSLLSDLLVKDGLLDKFDVKLLVECARSAKDVTTRNHVFSLLSSVAKIVPDQVMDHIIDIFTVMGESAISQNDSHSQHVFEDLISTVVPWWLSKTDDAGKLLQIFIDVLPEVAEHRRRSLMVYLMRTLGEKSGLSLLLFLLFRSLAQRTTSSSNGEIGGKGSLLSGINNDWEYNFAVQVCEQYACLTWLPSLGMLLHEIEVRTQGPEQIAVLQVAMRFIEQKLQDTELAFLLESGQDEDDLQRTLGTLMELVGCNLQLVDARNKQLTVPSNVRREFKDHIHCILRTITRSLGPSSYFKAMSGLLSHADENVRKKSLGILIDTVKDHDLVHRKHKEARKSYRNKNSLEIHIDATDWESFNEVCLKIVQLVDDSDSDTAAKLAAVSSLEVLANKFPSNSSIYIMCLTSITKYICSDNLAVSSGCLRCTGALINVLGPKALAELPNIMEKTLKRAHEVSSCSAGKFKHNCNGRFSGLSNFNESLLLSILVMLDAVIEKLGVFLNPYLEDIIELMVLHREYSSESDLKLKQKADAIRRLLTEKIPVRLILTPLLNIYPKAAKCGESSLSEVFTMLASTIGKMDKTSVRSYHAKIFDQCLLALDLRRQHPVSVQNIDFVEESVIHAIIGLTMKLTETMFRPLFFRSLEWAEIESEEDMASNSKNLDRMLSLYKLVNKLAEQQRSLFVPYFKFLLESCTRYLTDDQEPSLTQKRKKPKVQETGSTEERGVLSISQWHLRALILSSLHKCFLYDTGSLKFLDSSKFQVLLRPIVSQLVAEPPASLQQFSNIPSVEEVDDTLVSCLSQMAVAAGTDVLWKSLNHEVLMQTRSEKIRARMLGLRVVKCLLERLKEEYLVFLAETIPFLGELLEDAELSVKSLAQQILQEMEILSGENIKEYL